MLKTLTLKNFRSYKDQKFVFHRGVNAIIGEGLAGKSNILRAIRRIKDFRPINLKFMSHFAPKNALSEIELKTSDGFVVNLKQGRESKPVYTLQNKTGKTQTFRKINKKVPSEVRDALNLKEINFQSQLDLPYIISNSAGQVTKIINNITKVSSVDNWIKRINQDVKSLSIILDDAVQERKSVREDIAALKDLEKLEPIMEELQKLEQQQMELERKYYAIESIVAEIKAAEQAKKRLERALKAEDIIKEAIKIEEQLEDLEDKQDEIISLLDHQSELGKLRKEFSKKLNGYIRVLKKSKRCPTCLSRITAERIKEIRHEINRH